MGQVSGAMLLGAGLGTRLRPLTDRCAKPMVPVGDAPAIAHVLAKARLATDRIVVNVHHRPDDLRGWAETEAVAVSHEPLLRGTAGGVSAARHLLGDGDVLVWNGDILSDLDPRALVRAHAGAEATLAVEPRPAGQGSVGLGADGRLVRLRGETFGDEVAGGEYVGVHVFSQTLRARIPAEGCIVRDVWLPALRRGELLATFETEASFIDIGSLAHYRAANRAWLKARGLASWAHATAEVRPGVAIAGSVIGAHAVVEADALGAVVWARARVRSACSGVVVTAD